MANQGGWKPTIRVLVSEVPIEPPRGDTGGGSPSVFITDTGPPEREVFDFYSMCSLVPSCESGMLPRKPRAAKSGGHDVV